MLVSDNLRRTLIIFSFTFFAVLLALNLVTRPSEERACMSAFFSWACPVRGVGADRLLLEHLSPMSKIPLLSLSSAKRVLDWSTPLGFCLSNVVSSATGLPPQTMLNLAAGSYHGVTVGTLLFVVSATIGGLLGFLLMRTLLRGMLLRAKFMQPHRSKWEALDRAISMEGAVRLVTLLRLSPAIPFMPATALLSFTEVSFAAFAIGTLIGLVPFTAIYAFVGVAGKELLTGGLRNPQTLALTAFGVATTIALTVYINSVASTALAAAQI